MLQKKKTLVVFVRNKVTILIDILLPTYKQSPCILSRRYQVKHRSEDFFSFFLFFNFVSGLIYVTKKFLNLLEQT
jgi:hypothetical protein